MTAGDDPYDLERFLAAQDNAGTFDRAVAELRAGRKTTHWIWFVFPQIAGLGHSSMSKRYAISSLDEAKAYLAHPALGRRLVDCASIVAGLAALDGVTARDVLGGVDAKKLQSSMTLFVRAAPREPVFAQVLARWFDGVEDQATNQFL